jgi:hypothetical protein
MLEYLWVEFKLSDPFNPLSAWTLLTNHPRHLGPVDGLRRVGCSQGVTLRWEAGALEGAEGLFALGQGQPELVDALRVLLESDDRAKPKARYR